MMLRLFSARVPASVLIAVLLLLPAAFVGFGRVLVDHVRGRSDTALGAAALTLVQVPDNAKALIRGRDVDPRHAANSDRFDAAAGWTLPGGGPGLADEGFLLLSRYSGDEDRHVVELVDLRDFSIRHVWRPDASVLLRDMPAQASLTRIRQSGGRRARPVSRRSRQRLAFAT